MVTTVQPSPSKYLQQGAVISPAVIASAAAGGANSNNNSNNINANNDTNIPSYSNNLNSTTDTTNVSVEAVEAVEADLLGLEVEGRDYYIIGAEEEEMEKQRQLQVVTLNAAFPPGELFCF